MEQEGQKGQGAFTPGPWRVEGGNCTPENFHRNGFAKAIASIGKEDGDWRPVEQQVADAFLIAAAPDMLQQLGIVADWLTACLECAAFQWDGDQRECAVQDLDAARAAILKATRGSL